MEIYTPLRVMSNTCISNTFLGKILTGNEKLGGKGNVKIVIIFSQ